MTAAATGLADGIRRQLPYLRRYARALTGAQAAGDGLVAAALTRAAVSLTDMPEPAIKQRLFAALHEVAAAEAGRSPTPSGALIADAEIVSDRVRQLPPLARELLLLTMLEGFSADEAAEIAGLPPERAAALLAEARSLLTQQPASRILVIEDQAAIAMDIIGTVTGLGHAVVGLARTRDEAVALAGRGPLDLILADIQLADGSSGREAVQAICVNRPLPVVFITAYPEELLTGERPEPAFLVTKPFTAEMLSVAVAQALTVAGAPGPG